MGCGYGGGKDWEFNQDSLGTQLLWAMCAGIGGTFYSWSVNLSFNHSNHSSMVSRLCSSRSIRSRWPGRIPGF
jgi:hypothetical protein